MMRSIKILISITISILCIACDKADPNDISNFPREWIDGELIEYHKERYIIYLTADYDLLSYKRITDNRYTKEVIYDWAEDQLKISTTHSGTNHVNEIIYALNEEKKVISILDSSIESNFIYDAQGRLLQQDFIKKDSDGTVLADESQYHHYDALDYKLESVRELKGAACETLFVFSDRSSPFNVNFFEAKLFGQEALPLISDLQRYSSCSGGAHYSNYSQERFLYSNYQFNDNDLVEYLERKAYGPRFGREIKELVYLNRTTFEYHIE